MDQRQFDEMMDHWLKRQEAKAASGKEELLWAVNAGITDGGRPQGFVTCEEAAGMLRRALEYFFRQMIGILQEK